MSESYKPTAGMREEAQRGLDWRKEYGRGGTEVGVARARDIVNGKNLSEDTVKRMFSFFSRHEVDKQAEGFSPGEEGYPSAGRIAWALWGGDAGFSWSRDNVAGMDEDRAVQTEEKDDTMPEEKEGAEMVEQRAEPNELSVGDWVEWDSSGGEAYGKIERIERDGQIDVPDADVVINGDEDDPAALIEVYREGEDGWEASGVMVGHRFSTLTKVEERGYKKEDRFSRDDMKTRAMSASANVIDEERRTVRIAISSEEPVERSFGMEILDHSEQSIDLEFAQSGRMPLLLDHDPRQQIGVVEDVEIDSATRRLRGTVRFGRGTLANEIYNDVADDIRGNISVGYAVNKMDREGSDSYRVSSWTPMEVSVVSIPADRTVGVGRNADDDLQSRKPETPRKEITMSEQPQIDVEAVKAEAARAAAKDTAEMYRLAAKHNQRDLADKAISEGKDLAAFRGELLEAIGDKPLDNQDIGMERKEVKNFSLMRAIRAMANPTDRKAADAARGEFEASAEAAKRAGVDAQGLYIPTDVLRSWGQRDLNTSDDSAMVAEDYRAGDFIDVLRNASSVMQAGATMLTGLVGDVKIPRKSTASSAAFISTEGGAAAESEPTFGQVTMSPKTLGAFTDITRLMMMQSSLDIEALVRNDLSTALALAIDNGALQGSGSSGNPTGIKNTSGINAPTAFAAANPTFAEVVAMETAVAEDNALMGNLAYILPAGMYGALKTTVKDSGSGQFVVEPGNTINGYRAIVSNQVTAGDLYFGNFSDLLVGMYGGLDITVDPYTNSTSGTVRIVALQTIDVAVRHAVSFAFNNDGV
ncbi:MAG: phage major capsid protein [Herbaspirillum sp.]|uniref:phage major capsid protein n=1 Tax=Herbaspirillum sp. TaxID=1890675 RepID=UPI002582E8EB|nr:phage major capsid protein [Herbaspirillum sp.]MCP3654352.1 phage major capsid protein [Herbaspirillum sp.]